MRSFKNFTRALGAASLLALAATPSLAMGKHDRAEVAITEAQAKIDAANRVGASSNTPHLAATAEAELRLAKENLSAGHKEAAIGTAIHAGQLADSALNQAHSAQVQATRDSHANAVEAQAAAADANARADAANMRADAATDAAQSAAADANAAKAAAAAAAAAPPPAPATTVTTETTKTSAPRVVASSTPVKKTVTKRRTTVAPRTTETTRTTVTTTPQN